MAGGVLTDSLFSVVEGVVAGVVGVAFRNVFFFTTFVESAHSSFSTNWGSRISVPSGTL